MLSDIDFMLRTSDLVFNCFRTIVSQVFQNACAETAIVELLVKILTTPFHSLTPVCLYNTKFWRFDNVFMRFGTE